MRLWDKSNLKLIAVFTLLIIILVSISDPLPRVETLISQELNLEKATPYRCISTDLPEGILVYFFGNPIDPAASSNLTALYYRAQFFLAPRLLYLITLEEGTANGEIKWFIGANLDDEQSAMVSQQFHLENIKQCGALTLFHKIESSQ